MPSTRRSSRVVKQSVSVELSDDEVAAQTLRHNHKRKRDIDEDVNEKENEDEKITIVSPITPARKRRAFQVQITPAESTFTSTRGSQSPMGSIAVDTPATSVSDHECDKITSTTRSRRARAVTRGTPLKIEQESELSELDELLDDGDASDVVSVAAKSRKTPKGSRTSRLSALNKKSTSTQAKLESDVEGDDASDEDYQENEDTRSAADPVDGDTIFNLSDDEDEALAAQLNVARRGRRSRQPQPALSQYQKTMRKLLVHHPELESIWGDLETRPVIIPVKAAQPAILTLKLLPFQLEGLYWLRQQEHSEFRGGILADEMGMGKTIQTVAMLVSDTSRDKQAREAGTLIVAPTVALMQWRSEIQLYTNNALSILIYHGANREQSIDKLKEYDIVLTTYNLLESVWRKQQSGFKRKDGVVKEQSVLHTIIFHRIVLDEAHNIKDRSCGTARAVFNLQSKLHWCLSGTPLQNRVGELFSLLRFLQANPYSYYFCMKCPCKSLHWKFSDKRTCDDCGHRPMSHTCWFNHELLKPIQRFGAEGEGLTAFKKIHNLLRRLMLRRTKVERADDMGLPPRVVRVRRDLFNDEEEDMYESLYTESKRKFNTYADQGTILNNYANIFQLITRMRQMADHPDLILKRNAEAGQNQIVCRLCDDISEDAIQAKCRHIFCRTCVQDYQEGFVGASPDCPVCHLALNIDLTAPALEVANDDLIKRNSILNRIDMSKWRSSTKIEALVEELYKLRAKDSSIKCIVFSQWTSFLELVNWRLRRAGFSSCKLDGTMTPEARANTINHFSNDPSVSVFLVSLKAGGVALNLTEASQ